MTVSEVIIFSHVCVHGPRSLGAQSAQQHYDACEDEDASEYLSRFDAGTMPMLP